MPLSQRHGPLKCFPRLLGSGLCAQARWIRWLARYDWEEYAASEVFRDFPAGGSDDVECGFRETHTKMIQAELHP